MAQEAGMMSQFRPACLALAVIATTVPASAQTWTWESDSRTRVYEYEPRYEPRVYYEPRWGDRYYEPRVYESRAYEPDTRVVVTGQPLALTPTQRTTIYRTTIPQGGGRGPIVRERIVTETVAPAPVVRERVVTETVAPGPVVRERVVARPVEADNAYDYTVGSRVTDAYALAPMPRAVVTAVPAVRPYRYMVINNRVLLVEPATGYVVAEITE
jgi:hypothetical protein